MKRIDPTPPDDPADDPTQPPAEEGTSPAEDSESEPTPQETLQTIDRTVTSLVEGAGVQSVMRRDPEIGEALRTAKQEIWAARQAETPDDAQDAVETAFDELVTAYQSDMLQPRLPPTFRTDVLEELQRLADDFEKPTQDASETTDDSSA